QVAGALGEQQKLQVTCATQKYINQTAPADYLLGIPFEGQSYEITTLSTIAGEMFSVQALRQAINAALATLSPTVPSSHEAKLLSWSRVYYAQVTEDETHTLPLGNVTLPVLLAAGQAAEFSQAQIAEAFENTPLQAAALQAKLESGYYKKDTTSNYWWNTGSSAEYFGANEFYTASATVDPAGNKTTYTY
ncbi:hypothetical protein GR268_44205, partial [Rhizobium leguminosarum]|nr:hypothetical protein [Rhizobium leguminosarum]